MRKVSIELVEYSGRSLITLVVRDFDPITGRPMNRGQLDIAVDPVPEHCMSNDAAAALQQLILSADVIVKQERFCSHDDAEVCYQLGRGIEKSRRVDRAYH